MKWHNGLCVSVHLKNTSKQDLRGRKCVCVHDCSSGVKCCYAGVERQREKIRERTELLIITLRGNTMIEALNTWTEEKKTERNGKWNIGWSECISEKDFKVYGNWNKTWLMRWKEDQMWNYVYETSVRHVFQSSSVHVHIFTISFMPSRAVFVHQHWWTRLKTNSDDSRWGCVWALVRCMCVMSGH